MEPSHPAGRGKLVLVPQPQPSTPKKETQLQGPRPSPLRVTRDSHAIRKPPRHPPPHAGVSSAAPPARPPAADPQQPTIIFDISPKVIHVEERNFMSIVQQLTGSSSGDVSPAARIAAIERTSPTGREKGFAGVPVAAEMGGSSARAGDDDLMGMLGEVELRQFQGILSPAPAAIPAIPAGFFSPATDTHLLQDLSPYWHGNYGYNSPSSSTLFPALSPSPTSSIDLFNLFSNF
ncbi:VQ domain-containing protein [Psidium guajava]|nr:VQ domain-containing protein [Psidium guajava]